MSSLVSLVVRLRPTRGATVPTDLGPACQAWFLELVGAADAALARRLHADSRLRPYTVSSVQGAERPEQGRVALDPRRPVWVRFTSLEARLSAVLLEEVRAGLPATVALGGAELTVEGATADATAHPWARQSGYEALLQQHLLRGGHPRGVVGLQFVSPTVFRRTGGTFEGRRVRDHGLAPPPPGLGLGRPGDRWGAFGAGEVGGGGRRFAGSCGAMGGFCVRTGGVGGGGGRPEGGGG
nr:hypothetical protein [Ardenticatenia bacterium]